MIYEGSVMTGCGRQRAARRRQAEPRAAQGGRPEGRRDHRGRLVRGRRRLGARPYPNPAKATWVSASTSSRKGIATPVINLPTCPVNPEWIVAMVVDVLLLGKLESGAILDELDEFGRPKLIFGQTIHDNCPRRGHFENGEFVYQFGSAEEAKGYCLYAVGCKGPQTYTNCPIVRWNNQVSPGASSPVRRASAAATSTGSTRTRRSSNRFRQIGIGQCTAERRLQPGQRRVRSPAASSPARSSSTASA